MELKHDPNKKIVRLHEPCPSCPSTDAYCLYEDGHGYCFSCQTFTGTEKDDRALEFTYEFLPWRSVSADTFRYYGCQTKVDPEGKPTSIGFKYPEGAFKVRLLDKKEFYTTGDISKEGLFGRNLFASGGSKYVTITEGELDALSYYQVLRAPVVSVHSSSSAARDVALDRSWLQGFERIYLAFDNDEAGRAATASVARLFDYSKIYHVKFSNRKDANEYLQAGETEELRRLWWNSKQYLPETIVSSQEEFSRILSESPKWGVPYPFPTLTEKTYGIRTGEVVLLTAQEGVGKTELMHAVEYQLLKETKDAIAAFFLEEPQRRHLQALAGLHLQRPVHLPDCGCSVAEIDSALRELVQTDDRLHLYSHFGSDDPELLLDTIRFLVCARGCRYVLLDHITMACGMGSEEDERRKLDNFATKTQMMVKELDFGLIIVSHVNDFGQTRGSRYISKVADIRIDVTRDIQNPDDAVRNTTSVSVSKNRYAGKTGPAGQLLFNPVTFSFKEIEDVPPAANDNFGGRDHVGHTDRSAA